MKTFDQLIENLQPVNENLAKMAADHAFHHQMAEVEGSAASERKAKKIHDKIKDKHGSEVAKAVRDHSHHANNIDNGSGVGKHPKGFHKAFVKKHLGGDHAAYKKAAHANWYDHPPHTKQ